MTRGAKMRMVSGDPPVDLVDTIDEFELLPRAFTENPALAAAYWYLRGAAEASDMTIGQLLGDVDTRYDLRGG